jgi:hypothetical protein
MKIDGITYFTHNGLLWVDALLLWLVESMGPGFPTPYQLSVWGKTFVPSVAM